MSPHTNVLSLARRFQLHLNDREEDQVGGILNLIPYMVQTAADVTTAISAHSHDLEQAENEEMKRYTISSSFSFPRAPAKFSPAKSPPKHLNVQFLF